MGNYNVKCETEECRTKVRKLEKDVFYCKNHRCIKLFCNLEKDIDTHYCKYHQ